ncbi:MAG: carbonic anhydrase family protein [Algicola sp.]|nr:carbonic anhydrase family protein [Algicola sp.]
MKSIRFTLILLVLAVGCQNTTQKIEPSRRKTVVSHKDKHWSYEGETGPNYWKEIEVNSDCGGKYQSPINIVNYDSDTTLAPLDISYSQSTHIHDVVNNGHSIQYNFDTGDYMTLNQKRFDLKQFHFHEPAEHLIDGIRYPLVLHLVHMSDNEEYAVIAVMAKEGQSSEPFDFLESFLPVLPGQTATVDQAFDMNLNLPEHRTYFNYTGSLTTPPCSESVEWFIFKDPITVSLKQVEQLRALMPLNNYRNEQPHNGRRIRISK